MKATKGKRHLLKLMHPTALSYAEFCRHSMSLFLYVCNINYIFNVESKNFTNMSILILDFILVIADL